MPHINLEQRLIAELKLSWRLLLAVYVVFVNLLAVLWLGGLAITTITA